MESLSASVAAKRRLDAEAAARAYEVAVQACKKSTISNLRGQQQVIPQGTAQSSALLTTLLSVYEKTLSHFMDAGIALTATTPAAAAGAESPPDSGCVIICFGDACSCCPAGHFFSRVRSDKDR